MDEFSIMINLKNITTAEISLILPYYNEVNNINDTFNLILNQNITPKEIIFIDSNSSDNSFNLLNDLIYDYKNSDIKFLNLHTKINTPSEAKNFGLSKSQFDIIAFMDFELIFNSRWIESQYNLLLKYNVDIVFGVANLKGKTNFDKACCFQTFGYMSGIPIVPSSMMYKKIFVKAGLFIPIRSVYDKLWIQGIFNNKLSYLINNDVSIDYANYSFAKNTKYVFLKIFNTSLQSVFIKGYHSPYFYFLIFMPIILFPNFYLLCIYCYLFIFIRGFYLPYKKNNKYYWKNIHLFFYFIYTGFIIDFSKIIGFTLAVFLKIFKKKIRIDKFYNN